MRGLLLILLVIAISANNIEGKFFRGKHFNSRRNLVEQLSSGIGDDPELWFDQILDHFEPTNNATWKQV